jgi:hypothetical protein
VACPALKSQLSFPLTTPKVLLWFDALSPPFQGQHLGQLHPSSRILQLLISPGISSLPPYQPSLPQPYLPSTPSSALTPQSSSPDRQTLCPSLKLAKVFSCPGSSDSTPQAFSSHFTITSPGGADPHLLSKLNLRGLLSLSIVSSSLTAWTVVEMM